MESYCGFLASPRWGSNCVLKLSEEDRHICSKEAADVSVQARRYPDPVTVLDRMRLFYRHLCHLPWPSYQTIERADPEKLEFPNNLMLLKEKADAWCQPEEELVSQEEMLHSSDNLSDHHVGQTRAETITCQWWAGPHLDEDCLVMHTSCPLFNLNLLSGVWRIGVGGEGSMDIWVPLLSVAILNKPPFLAFHCLLSL